MSVSTLSNQSVSIENPAGTRNRTGQTTFLAAATASVRFERTYKTIKTENREREPVHAVMGCPSTVSVSVGARVTYGSDIYRVLTVSEAVGGDGTVHHLECNLQLWSYA